MEYWHKQYTDLMIINERLIEKRNAATCLIERARQTIKLVVENYERDRASDNFLGDDDHELWGRCSGVVSALDQWIKENKS